VSFCDLRSPITLPFIIHCYLYQSSLFSFHCTIHLHMPSPLRLCNSSLYTFQDPFPILPACHFVLPFLFSFLYASNSLRVHLLPRSLILPPFAASFDVSVAYRCPTSTTDSTPLLTIPTSSYPFIPALHLIDLTTPAHFPSLVPPFGLASTPQFLTTPSLRAHFGSLLIRLNVLLFILY